MAFPVAAPSASFAGISTHIHLACCASTNDEAARLARAGAAHGTLVTADAQTAGRGRAGRSWVSSPGNVFLSMVLRVPVALADVPALTLALGVGACDALRSLGAPVHLKWPNDIIVVADGRVKKLAGILVETQSAGYRVESVIAGIGVNIVGPTPPELAPRMAQLSDLGIGCTPESVVPVIARAWLEWTARFVGGGVAAVAPAWEARMYPVTHRLPEGEAVAQGLEPDGALRLLAASGPCVHRFGDAPAVDWL